MFNPKAKVNRPRYLGVIMGLLIALSLLSCSKPEPIRIGVNAWPPCEIWYVAQDQGFFGNLDVEIVRFSAWTDNMRNFYQDRLDITHGTYFNAIYYTERGTPGRILISSDTIEGGDGFVLKAVPASPDAVRGLRVAVEVNTDEHFLLDKALQDKYGLTIQDVELVPLTTEEAMKAFIAGEVDGAALYEPYLSQAAAEGSGTVVWTTKDSPGYMIDVLVGRESTIKDRPKDLRRVLEAWYRAQDWIRQNPQEAMEIMAKSASMPVADFTPFYGSFTFYSLEQNKELFSSTALRDRLGELDRFLRSAGLLKVSHTYEELVAPEIIEGIKVPE